MVKTHCTLCFMKHECPPSKPPEVLESQLPPFFLVRKLLGLSDSLCGDLLETYGSPSAWGLSTCTPCNALVHEATVVQRQMDILERKMKDLRTQCEAKIIESQQNQGKKRGRHYTERFDSPVGKIRAEVVNGLNTSTVDYSSEPVMVVDEVEDDENDDLNSLWEPDKFEVFSESDTSSCSGSNLMATRKSRRNKSCRRNAMSPSKSPTKTSNEFPFPDLIIVPSDVFDKNLVRTDDVEEDRTFSNNDWEENDLNLRDSDNEFEAPLFSSKTQSSVPPVISGSAIEVANEITIDTANENEKCNSQPNENEESEKAEGFEDVQLSSNSENEFESYKKHKQGRQRCSCFHCGKKFKSRVLLLCHIKTHGKRLERECEECGKTFTTFRAYKIHKSMVHGGKASCTVCRKEFKNRSLLMNHTKVEHKDTNKEKQPLEVEPECLECHRTFKSMVSYKTHVFMMHGEKCSCSVCGQEFKTRSMLMNHIKLQHKEKKEVKKRSKKEKKPLEIPECLECKRTFKSMSSYKTHIFMMHGKPCNCSVCGEEFNTRSLLMNHMKTHKEVPETEKDSTKDAEQSKWKEPESECLECHRKFKSRAGLLTHNHMLHGGKIACSTCGEDLESRAELMNHMKTHQQEAPINFMCEVCSKGYRTQQHLKLHQAKMHGHSISKKSVSNLKCEVCGEILSHTRSLRRHMQGAHPREDEERPMKCEKCPYATWTKFELRKHVAHIHDGVPRKKREKKYCPECSKGYASKEYLDKHMKEVHGHSENKETKHYNSERKCPHCRISVKNMRALLIHLNSEHGENHVVSVSTVKKSTTPRQKQPAKAKSEAKNDIDLKRKKSTTPRQKRQKRSKRPVKSEAMDDTDSTNDDSNEEYIIP